MRCLLLHATLSLLLAAAPAGAQIFVPAPQVWTQAYFPAESIESFDDFGSALAAGDFNGDGFADLAMGAPGEDFPGTTGAGVVGVLYGGGWGLQAAGAQTLRPLVSGMPTGSPGDEFGAELAMGDFDGDGFADLAVGMTGAAAHGPSGSGQVQVFFGSAAGFTARTQSLFEGSGGIDDTPDSLDHFGTALAAGDFDGDGFADLAIGVPGASWAIDSGAVHVLWGGPAGLSLDSQLIHQEVLLPDPDPSYNDRFGGALAAGNFNGDGFADLAIGAPGAWVGVQSLAGRVWVLRGWSGGLDRLQPVRLSQDSTPKWSVAESFDQFGGTLATGDVDGDGRDELAVAAPWESLGSVSHAGAVSLFYGTPAGIGTARAQFFHQGTPGVAGDPGIIDRLGAALVLGDTTGDGRADLVAGIPFEGTTGATQRFFAGFSSLSLTDSQLRLQPGNGAPETYDNFGQALALGDFDGNGVLDLAVGAPGEDLGTATDAGQVHVTYHERPLVIGP